MLDSLAKEETAYDSTNHLSVSQTTLDEVNCFDRMGPRSFDPSRAAEPSCLKVEETKMLGYEGLCVESSVGSGTGAAA